MSIHCPPHDSMLAGHSKTKPSFICCVNFQLQADNLKSYKNITSGSHTSSLLNAFALGQHEWFIQLCKGKNAVPKTKLNYVSHYINTPQSPPHLPPHKRKKEKEKTNADSSNLKLP